MLTRPFRTVNWFPNVLTFSILLIKIVVSEFDHKYSKVDPVTERKKSLRLGCVSNEDCMGNASCSTHDTTLNHKFCLCNAGFVGFRTGHGDVCLREASRLGDLCTENIQCSARFGREAECQYSKHYAGLQACQCRQGSTFINELCEKQSKIGESCKVSDNCPQNVFCDKSVCVCPYNHEPNFDGTKCIKISNLGEHCHNDQSCLDPYSRCYEGICHCAVTHVENSLRNGCLPAANNLSDKCSEDQQCRFVSPHSKCLSGICQCIPEYHQISNICYPSVGLRGWCTDSRQCFSNSTFDADMHCKDEQCTCKEGMKPDPSYTKCIPSPTSSSSSAVVKLSVTLIWYLMGYFYLTYMFHLFK